MEMLRKQINSKQKVSKLKLIKYSRFFVLSIVLLSLFACKARKINTVTSITKKSSAKEIVAAHSNKDLKFNTLQSRMRVSYFDGKKSLSPSVSLRMEKNKQIWLSVKVLGITMAKAYITPNKVSFYEKLTKRFYEGNFEALSNFLGTDVSYNMLQNLIVGQSIVGLDQQFELQQKTDTHTQLIATPQSDLYSLLLSFYNDSIKVATIKLQKDQENFNVNYKEYQKVENQDFPKFIAINSSSEDSTDVKKIDMEFKSVILNETLTFPYKIPDGYKALSLN